MRKQYRWLLIFLLLYTFSAAAQEGTEVPVTSTEPPSQVIPEFVYAHSVELGFPEAIAFKIVLDRPIDMLASVVLTVDPPNSEPVDFVLTPLRDVISPPDARYTELLYVWNVPHDNPPPVFGNILYRWQVVTTRDEVANFVDTVYFTDPRTEWRFDTDPDGVLDLALPQGAPEPSTIRNLVRDIYALMSENTGQTMRFNLILFNEELLPGCTIFNGQPVVLGVSFGEGARIPCDLDFGRAIYERSGYEIVEYNTKRQRTSIQKNIARHMFEHLYASLLQNEAVPAWFIEGLFQFYLPDYKFDRVQIIQQAARTNLLFDLTQPAPAPTDDRFDLWYAQSYGLVLFMADQIGVSSLFDFANSLSSADDFASAYESAVGTPLSALLPAFETWIFTDEALYTFGFTPYMPDTPTPTQTRTPTPFPPTDTPFPTSTPTFTPSPTVTGFHTATPLPTLTPSNTPRPATATNTPRPPDSLRTPTLPPAVPEVQAESPVSPALIVLIGAIFAALGVLTYIYLRMLQERD